jgi:hypothetical protein
MSEVSASPVSRRDTAEPFDGVHVPKRTRGLFLAVSLLTLAVYLFSGRGVPVTVDEAIVFQTTKSLAQGRSDFHAPLIANFHNLTVKRPNGRLAGIYGIGTSAVGAPLYLIGKAVAQISPPSKRPQILLTATMFTNAIIVATTVFMLMLVCMLLRAPPVGAVLIGLSYGIGSYAFPHALTLFTEPGTAMCLIAAVFFAIRASRRGARSDLLACGALAGAANLFRVSAVLFLPVLGLWLLVAAWRTNDFNAGWTSRMRRVFRCGAWFAAGAAGPVLLLFVVNRWRYGSATNFGYALGTATNQSYPILRGLMGQWLSSGKSLFLFAPIAIIVLFGLGRSLRKAPMEMILLGSLVIVNTLFFARVQFWSGDWAWGPRYMQIVVPCLAAMAAPLMDARVWRRALVAVSVLGFFFAALPAVLVRFTLIFFAARRGMPVPSDRGPTWDHSYLALIWHTLHWQQILYQLRLLPNAFVNSVRHVTSPVGPARFTDKPDARVEFWWLRARDLGSVAVLCFTLLSVFAAGVGLLGRYFRTAATVDAPTDSTGLSGALIASELPVSAAHEGAS